MNFRMSDGMASILVSLCTSYPSFATLTSSLVPIATRRPPDNVYFEMADVNQAFRFQAEYFDFVHARAVSMAVCNSILAIPTTELMKILL